MLIFVSEHLEKFGSKKGLTSINIWVIYKCLGKTLHEKRIRECLGHVERQRGLEIAISILTECTCNQCSVTERFERHLTFQGTSKPTGEWYVRRDSTDQ